MEEIELTIKEVHYAQRLACNDRKLAEKALKTVGKWFAKQSVDNAVTTENLMKIWKGLFYFFWNADKPLVQEEKADVISSYIHVFETDDSFMYIDTFFQTMAREWLAIDRYRIEKFMMLVRKFLHQTYQLLKHLNWEKKHINQFHKVLRKTVLNGSPDSTTPLGLKIHICDIYMEELAKVAAEEITPKKLQRFLKPYCRILVESDETVFLNGVSKDVFLYLINQSVDEDLFHEFPVLKFDADAVQNLLMEYASKPDVRKLNRKAIYKIVKQFEDYKNGVSAVDKILSDKSKGRRLRKRDVEKASLNLFNEELACSEEKREAKKRKKISEDDVIDL